MIVYRELSSLEKDLGFHAKQLYAVSNRLEKHYHRVQIPKKSGGVRVLSVPDEVLKAIQRKITEVLLAAMPVSRYAAAYHCGASTVKNARCHVGKTVVLKLDILHFFDSIRYADVKAMAFPQEIYAEPIRVLLTMLCYYKDALPQGAPSSPIISNIILYDFDEEIGQWCREQGISYTRYCDDLTFSGSFSPRSVIAFMGAELKKHGFLLNKRKIHIQFSGQRQTVTGIVVNEKPSVPAAYRRGLRQELYYCQKFGISEHLKRSGAALSEENYRMRLLGKVNYVLRVDPGNGDMKKAKQWLLEAGQVRGTE